MSIYALVYFISWLLAILTTPVVIAIARKFQMVDHPDIRKVHSFPISRIGGVAIFISIMIPLAAVLLLSGVPSRRPHNIQPEVMALLGGATFIFFVGFIDDIKGLRARTKFFCQLLAAAVVCASGIRISSINVTDTFVLDFGSLAWPLTLLWIVGVTNAVNFIDGLDGLAAGLAAIACGVIVLLSICFSQPVIAVISLCLLGSLIGFLAFNFHPARIFMGDCGSLFLGFTIASMTVLCAARSKALVTFTLPILALGIPIFDTLISILRRFIGRRSILSADRAHFHHRLLALGLNHRQVVIIAYAETLIAVGLGMFMIFTNPIQTMIIFLCILLLFVLAFVVAGSVTLRETINGLKRKYAVTSDIKREKDDFAQIQLHFSQAQNFEQWWQSVCHAAAQMNFITILLPLTNRDGTKRLLTWKKNTKQAETKDLVKMILPVRDRRCNSELKLEAQIHAAGSLESAGRRLTLFSRLIEEHGMEKLPNKPKAIESPYKVFRMP